MRTNIYNVDYHGEVGKIVGPVQSASLSAPAGDYDSILAVLNKNGLLPRGTLVLDAVAADPSGSQKIYAFAPTTQVSYTLVATQNGANMNYTLMSNLPGFPLTSSFTIPVNPTPAGSPIVGSAFSLGHSTQIYPPVNFLFNGVAVTPVTLIFYNIADGGGIGAYFSNTQDPYYYITLEQLYSGAESAPTMLAGTFTLSQPVMPSNPYVYKVNYHFEKNGKRSSADLYDYVSAASQGYDDIAAVLASNNLLQPGTLVIDGVQTYNQALVA